MDHLINDLIHDRGTELFDLLDSRYDLTSERYLNQDFFHGYRFAFLTMSKSPRRYRNTFGDEHLYLDERAVGATFRAFAMEITGPAYLLDQERELIRILNEQVALLETRYKRSSIGLVS